MQRTLEEQFQESKANDPRLEVNEAFVRGVYLMGAQAVLESIRTGVPIGSPSMAFVLAIEKINDEIGAQLGISKHGDH